MSTISSIDLHLKLLIALPKLRDFHLPSQKKPLCSLLCRLMDFSIEMGLKDMLRQFMQTSQINTKSIDSANKTSSLLK